MEKEKEHIEKLHEYEADALKHFIRICEENQLEYYVIGGTLLGAVRHKGFIPWDDDIDVAMPRDSYERFLKIGPDCMPQHLLVESPHNKEDYRSYFGKIRNKYVDIYDELVENSSREHKALEEPGTLKEPDSLEESTAEEGRVGYMIDIIPLDGTPNHPLNRKIYKYKVLMYRFLCGAANVSTGILANRPKRERMILEVCKKLRLYKILNIKKIYKRMDRLFLKQVFRASDYSGTVMGAYNFKEIVPTAYWGEYSEASLWEFEGMKVKGPKMCHEYLTHIYGDYMKLPPESERRIHFQGRLIERKEGK